MASHGGMVLYQVVHLGLVVPDERLVEHQLAVRDVCDVIARLRHVIAAQVEVDLGSVVGGEGGGDGDLRLLRSGAGLRGVGAALLRSAALLGGRAGLLGVAALATVPVIVLRLGCHVCRFIYLL